MKRNILFFVMMVVALTGLVTMQSCTKESAIPPKEYLAPVPAVPVPEVDQVVPFTGANQAINLSWEGSATDAIKWDLYFGDSETPDLAAAGLTTNTYVAHVSAGGTYYWQLYTIDSRGVETYSPLWSFQVNSNPTVPVLTPANNAIGVSPTASLTWTTTDPEEDDLTYDVYLGTTATPPPVATGLTAATYSPTLNPTTVYYWKVVVKDPYGGSATSAVYKFTTGALPVVKFVGTYDVAENSVQNGAYAYVNKFAKVDNTTIQADNWWDSGWATKFVLDFTKNTIVMTPFTFVSGSSTYIGTGSGKIDQTTGKITLTYSVTKNGVLLENGTEIFTLKAAKSFYQEPVNKQPKY